MHHSVYRYNTETCRYERVGVSARNIIAYALGVLVMGSAMLAGVLILHDLAFDSEKEKALRKENAALTKNSVALSSQLTDIEATLKTLFEQDRKLHQKFFGTELPQESEAVSTKSHHPLLVADASAFRTAVQSIGAHSSLIINKAAQTNSNVASKRSLTPRQQELFNSIPALQPVKKWSTDNLISGFGMRVNPFHKGLYEHEGVDIAMPRGTEVISTAGGKVVLVNRSDVEAGYGNYIEIDHGHGFSTRYAHLDEIKVRNGQTIDKGTVIATIGNSGGSIAPHLHYEILVNGKNVDPARFMIAGLSSSEFDTLTARSQKQNQSLD